MRKKYRRHGAAPGGALGELLGELDETRLALSEAYARFNGASEPELIDACIYEINAIQARYSFLLRRVREQGGQAACAPFSGGAATWV